MRDDLVGKIMAVNSFELRHRPNLQMGDVTDETIREWRRRPRIKVYDVPYVAEALPPGVKWAIFSEDNVTAETPYGLIRSRS
jgi:putative ABC transport system permease protein